MKNFRRLGVHLFSLALAVAMSSVLLALSAPEQDRDRLQKLFNDGNYKDAYEGYRQLALDPATDPAQVGADLNMALSALRQLGRLDEVDQLRESAVKVHEKNWRLLMAAAESYLEYEHFGFIIAGNFSRGPHRGGGEAVNAMERDRVRALQLMQQALPLAAADANKKEVASFWLAMSRMLLANRGYHEAWRLQYLTDLDELPDYDKGWYFARGSRGAPVDDQGDPVFHHVPQSWHTAKTDGQRWRWALEQAIENDPSRRYEVRHQFADFLHSQFGAQTMAHYGQVFARLGEESGDDQSGPWALRSLAEDETIARLADGIKRFKLPEEFNFIAIYQEIGEQADDGFADSALQGLAQIFENRRQYPRAAQFWRKSIERFGPGGKNFKQHRLEQIVGNWGRFEPIETQPASQGASVEFRFRNGKKVGFEAHEIDIAKLLGDVKAYLKSNPHQLDWKKVNISDVGHRLVHENQKQYVGKSVAKWDLALEPRPDHLDKRITVSTPLQKAGAYLLTAKMEDGNTSKIVIWLADTAIVKKTLDGGTYYYVGDAVSGAPVAKANVEFFGYRQRRVERNRFMVDVIDRAELTDADGQIIVPAETSQNEYQWVVTARTDQGRLAYLGFTSMWGGKYYDSEYDQTKVFTITDRPVYRPGQKVQFKFWVRHARYDQEDKSDFANQSFNVEIQNPKGERILNKSFTADAYGGIEGSFELPSDAALGAYQLFVVNYGGGSFRVEEYKKPEFEVNIEAPSGPVMLGDKIEARIQAKYYFGSPVVNARVKYKVLRSSYDAAWYPPARWDWLFGRGYWWFAPNYGWYPGWDRWGCPPPPPWWRFGPQQPPEVVAEREAEIGDDGALKVEIDTAIAKLAHPDKDHRYTITAEVVDQSRRTIVGQGEVLVARKPFQVYAWVDRGYYRVGDVIHASFQAHTLDSKPVRGSGVIKLYQITYQDNKPVETEVRTWDSMDPDSNGRAQLQFHASAAGQYRIAYEVTDAKDRKITGAYLFTIMGKGFDGREFRFNDLELIPDKREYQPGQTANLMINTNRVGGTVLLFVRPSNGVYTKPKVMRLKGKSAVDEIPIAAKDMPNFFVEAVAISGGKLHTVARQLVVPPESRMLDVSVTPSSESYKPGQKAKLQLTLTDANGKPFVGSTVVSIYDKAVEYISGGSNVDDIKAFFWKWQRTHHPNSETNLGRHSWNLVPRGKSGMSNLGVFGEGIASDEDAQQSNPTEMNRDGLVRSGRMMRQGELAFDAAGIVPAPTAAMAKSGPASELAANARAVQEGAAQPLVQPAVRTQFADTALWVGSLATDEHGKAEVSLAMPENLTTWTVRTWAMGHGTKVGQGDAEVVTRKELIVRLQSPRFFIETDEVVLSANVHNYLKTDKLVTVSLELEGDCLSPLDDTTRQVEIASGGETRVDWRVKVVKEGTAVVRMKALSDEESDATEQKFPVYVHGMLKMESFSGALRPDETTGEITFHVPEDRRVEQSRLVVRWSPTLAGAMVDALPYLADYPYGCTEQTLNRFLPTVITQKILIDMGLDLKKIQEKRASLNAQEIGDPAERAAGWKRFDRNPVFDIAEVAKMVKDGVERLGQMQLSDGGWGWFSGWGEQSYPHTTAVVVHGLQVAKQNDVALPPGMLQRGVEWLKQYQQRQVQRLKNAEAKPEPTKPYKSHADNLDALVYMVLADADLQNDAMREYLYRDRNHLAVYSKAVFGLALHKQGRQEQLDMILRNISQYVVEDDENQTAYLQLPADNYRWYWYGSETEANAYYLKLLAETDPQGRLASRLVKYLLNNRKHATYWNSTRDTALAIEALAAYLKASGEDKPDLAVEVWLDGKKQKEVKITAADLFTFDDKFVLTGSGVKTGKHKLQLRKSGSGPLYYNAYLTNFTTEDFITAAGLEIKVQRNFYRLKAVDKQVKVEGGRSQPVDQKIEKFEREELENLAAVKSGDLIEVELVIDSKNDYEYLIFEDFKAAGFEPVDLQSGYHDNGLRAYMELRDRRVAFFVHWLARGKHSIAYRLRAETPGQFSALPAVGKAMYSPELKGNSDEMKVKIAD